MNGEDTIINDIIYKKVFIFHDTVFKKSEATYIGGIRQDLNKRVYYKGDTTIHDFKPMSILYNYDEIVLFDFSVNVGDTIENINCNRDMDHLVVSKIDTVLINNTLRKRISFNPMSWVKWIEGIGSIKGLLFTSGDLPTNGLDNDLICFKQNNKILYFNNSFSECFPELTGNEIKTHDYPTVKVYPNPGYNKINFSFGEQQIELLRIIDCTGQICGDFKISRQSEFLLSTEKYQPGIYLYTATNTDGMITSGKFVIR